MTNALLGGEFDHTADMERALRRQPQSPPKFQAPRHQQSSSPRPNTANDTFNVHHEDPPPQREGRLFSRRAPWQIKVATIRLVQLEAIVLDNHGGPCRTARAYEYLEDFISLTAIAGGQHSFDWLLDEIRVRLFPRIATGELEALVDKVLLDPLPYDSLALGKRHGVTAEQFERLDLSHIAPAGWSKRKLEAYRAKRRNSKLKDQRHESGKNKTRREMSIMQLKPWKLPGAPCSSRAGLYRLPPDVQDALVKRARAEAEMRR